MKLLQSILSFYLKSSLHVAVAVVSLTVLTYHIFKLTIDLDIIIFNFFGTIAGYNFIKYDTIFRKNSNIRSSLKLIFSISMLALIVVFYLFFKFNLASQILLIFCGLVVGLYALPLLLSKNLRNLSGVKIYLVALIWSGVTVLLPVINASEKIDNEVKLKFFQRFLLVIILLLIFEIIDLKTDDPRLKTLPQRIGVSRTKRIGFALLLLFFCSQFFSSDHSSYQWVLFLFPTVLCTLFLHFAHPERSRYYTTLWVESIPIFWLLLFLICQQWL